MKAVFIVFSPSGHTLIAARKFMSLLEDNGISCHMINITKNDKYLQDFTITKTLVDDLGEHHLLIPCAPVYAVVHPYIEVARKRLSDGFAKLENPQSEIYR